MLTPRKQKWARADDSFVRSHQAKHPHQVLAMDLQVHATADCRRLKLLTMIDEYIRLCLAIHVGRCCKAKDVVPVLEELNSLYPATAFIRSDNGPSSLPTRSEFAARTAPQPLPTSSHVQLGRTALLNSSTADSGINSSTPSYLPRLPRLNSWLIAGDWRTHVQVTFALQGRTPLEALQPGAPA